MITLAIIAVECMKRDYGMKIKEIYEISNKNIDITMGNIFSM